MKNDNLDKLWQSVEIARRKDIIETEIDKQKFANLVKNGVGEKINDFNSYIKPKPSIISRIKAKILRIFKYL